MNDAGFDARAFAAEAEEAMRSDPAGGGEEPSPPWPAPLDLADLAKRDPPDPKFIINNWIPSGYATLLAGHGGAGKSTIALHLAACIASGRDWWGRAVERRRVLYLSCEDRQDVLHWRLERACGPLDLGLGDLAGYLDVLDLVGRDSILWRPDSAGPTPAYRALADTMRALGTDVLMVDGVTDAYAGNENDRAQVKTFVNSLLTLISPDRGAIMLLGHVGKPAASGPATSEGYSGSTAWHNAVRSRWYLYPETSQDEDEDRPQKTGKLTLELQKSNLGRADQSVAFQWSDADKLFIGKQPESIGLASMRERAERESILDAMADCARRDEYVPAATTGQRTAHHVLAATGKLDTKLQSGIAGRRRFWKRIEELRQSSAIRETSIRRSNRHATAVLVLEPKE